MRVGHLSDSQGFEGIAHATEHLAFQGFVCVFPSLFELTQIDRTAEYPGENEYNAHLASHGGFSNAFTASDETRYFFSCGQAGFEEALDRFSRFFIDPLFKEDCVEREMRAVDAEHQKNSIDDGWRVMQLGRSLSRPG